MSIAWSYVRFFPRCENANLKTECGLDMFSWKEKKSENKQQKQRDRQEELHLKRKHYSSLAVSAMGKWTDVW